MSTIAAIDRRCDEAAKATKSKPDAVFADVSRTRQADWRAFRDPQELKKGGHGGEPPDTQAFVWRFPDGVLHVQFFLTSESGDWAQFTNHCYRPDGTVARTADELNTFEAVAEDAGPGDEGITQLRVRHWSPAGKLLKKTSRVFDLQTQRPVKAQVMEEQEVLFLRVSALPFYRLLTSTP
ncbi:MAG TPA: hypothetical protein VN962_16880 [Polyangia bacterium]|nr:hypothetical protein [Polyangia bacterium]